MNGKATRRLAGVVLCLALMLCACGSAGEPEEGARVYYLKTAADGSLSLVWEYRPRAEGTDREAQCEAALAAMLEPRQEGNFSALPAGLSVGLDYPGVVVYADLGAGFLDLPAGRQGLVTAAIALSLMEYGDAQYVAIKVEGQVLRPNAAPYGRNTFMTADVAMEHIRT